MLGPALACSAGSPCLPRSARSTSPDVHLLGYGDWTGAASATISGAARTSPDCVAELVQQLQNS